MLCSVGGVVVSKAVARTDGRVFPLGRNTAPLSAFFSESS